MNYFERLLPLRKPLHDIGCERGKASNRQWHDDQLCLDQLCVLLLLALFNPVVDRLRGLQQASELDNVQKRLPLSRASSGRSLKRPASSPPHDSSRSSRNGALNCHPGRTTRDWATFRILDAYSSCFSWLKIKDT